MKITVIGGGIAGLSCAYYLHKQGLDVLVVDRGQIEDGCSFGNMGYVSPSHFVPLATPGIVAQGLRWMLQPSSPFYIKPRLNLDLIRWGLQFWKTANARHVANSMGPLNDLLQLSRQLVTTDWKTDLADSFDLTEKGCWMLYKKEKTGDHEKELAEQAAEFGLKTRICSPAEVQELEPELQVEVAGGVMYYDDCHLHPGRLMRSLYHYLQKQGVKFWLQTDVIGFESSNNKLTRAISNKGDFESDAWVIANGSWIGLLSKKLGIHIPMQPGKGYSMSFEALPKNLQHPAILVDHRTATTPLDRWLRIGGTMELSGHNQRILPARVRAIVDAVKLYFPDIQLPAVDPQTAWYGYRPVSPDGMPYIGAAGSLRNCYFAGGHAMLGMSAAAGTGLLIAEMLAGKTPAFSLEAFRPERFS